jgi:predicted aconitase
MPLDSMPAAKGYYFVPPFGAQMFLTRHDESILDGEEGPGKQKAMEILTALGKIFDAEKLIPISSAHLSGVSYKTIGEGGLQFLDSLKGQAQVQVKTTLNPAGMDLERWKDMGVNSHFAERQIAIIDSYRSLGVQTCCTCTPYLHYNVPRMGEHVSWAESNALSFVNSVIGAMTNREGGPGALAAAIIGKTPSYGLHLEENRHPSVIVEADIGGDLLSHSLLGQVVGKRLGNAVPYIKGINPDIDRLKTMAAAMAAAGAIALFHVEGITPTEYGQELKDLERIQVDSSDIEEAKESLTSGKEPDLIALGCPHLSEAEVREIASILETKGRKRDIEVWFCTNRWVKERCPKEVATLERFGKVVCDTCMVVAPIEDHHACTGTNSAKACNYLPGLCSQKVFCDTTTGLLELIS